MCDIGTFAGTARKLILRRDGSAEVHASKETRGKRFRVSSDRWDAVEGDPGIISLITEAMRIGPVRRSHPAPHVRCASGAERRAHGRDPGIYSDITASR